MPSLLLSFMNPRVHAFVRRAMDADGGGRVEFRLVNGWPAALQALNEATPAVLVAEAGDDGMDGRGQGEMLRRWQGASGGVPIILVLPDGALNPQFLLKAPGYGVRAVIRCGAHEETEPLREAIRDILTEDPVEELLRLFRRGRSLPGEIESLIRTVASQPLIDDPKRGWRHRTPSELARICFMGRSHLYRSLSAHRVPSPARLDQVVRVFLALREARDQPCTVERAGLALGFSSSAAFSDIVARLTGLRPSVILRDEARWEEAMVELFRADEG